MSKGILMDEFHLSVFAPRRLAASEYDAIRRTLDGARFRAALSQAVRRVRLRFATLSAVRVAVTR